MGTDGPWVTAHRMAVAGGSDFLVRSYDPRASQSFLNPISLARELSFNSCTLGARALMTLDASI